MRTISTFKRVQTLKQNNELLIRFIIAWIIGVAFIWWMSGCSSLPPASVPSTPTTPEMVNYCDTVKDQYGNEQYSYCIRKIVNGKRKEVLWFNHGAMDDQDPWNLDTLKKLAGMTQSPVLMKQFTDLWGDDAPTIITVSFGRIFMVTGYPNRYMRPSNATVEFFTGTIMPQLEDQYSLVGRPRWIMGPSQGGANSFTLLASKPELFQKAVLINPMFNKPDCHPYDFINFNCSKPTMQVAAASYLVQQNYTGRQNWDEWGVYGLASKADAKLFPPTYIQCDSDDPWGFTFGVTKICAGLKLKEANVKCEILPGSDHIIWDPKKVYEWLKQ